MHVNPPLEFNSELLKIWRRTCSFRGGRVLYILWGKMLFSTSFPIDHSAWCWTIGKMNHLQLPCFHHNITDFCFISLAYTSSKRHRTILDILINIPNWRATKRTIILRQYFLYNFISRCYSQIKKRIHQYNIMRNYILIDIIICTEFYKRTCIKVENIFSLVK